LLAGGEVRLSVKARAWRFLFDFTMQAEEIPKMRDAPALLWVCLRNSPREIQNEVLGAEAATVGGKVVLAKRLNLNSGIHEAPTDHR
jgi:hypothetical protein